MGHALRLRDDEIAGGTESETALGPGASAMSWIRALASEWEAAREPLFEGRPFLAAPERDAASAARS